MITSTLRNLLYPLKLFISILMILMAANAYDASIESNDSDSDDIEINPFRQLPPQPTVDIEMESVTNYLNGMALEERDSSQYTKDLNAHIHKCQELHAVLCEMLKITTVACMYPYRWDREQMNNQFSMGLKYIDFVINQKDVTSIGGTQIKRYDLPSGEVHYIPSLNFISQSLYGAHIKTNDDVTLAKSILERLVPETDGCFKYLCLEREKFHNMMIKKMGL